MRPAWKSPIASHSRLRTRYYDMREKAKRIALILGVAVFIFFTFQYFSLVSKSYAYLLNASDLLGQLDENDQPVYTKMGIGNSPNNSGLNYPLAGIGGVTVDSSNHRLFLSDTYNNRVLIFNLDINNHLIDRIADYVLGQLNFSTNQGGIGSNVLNHPTNLIYDADGQRLFVLDPDNNRILIFDVNIIINGENAVNVLGQNDFLSNTSGLGPNKLTLGSSEVNGLTYDSVNKRLFVGDLGNNRIMIFDVLTITNGENAVNVLGAINLTTLGSGACATSSVYAVTDLTYDSTKQFLYVVAGWALTSQRVLVFDVNSITNGEDAINVLGQQDFITCTDGVAANKFSYPMGAVIDQANQKLYVADQNNFRILIFDVSTITNGENAVNVLGQTDFISNSGGTTQDKLNQPTALALSNNQLFVIDTRNNRLVIFDTEVISNGEAMVDLIGQTDDLYNAVYTNSNVNNSPNGRGFNSPTHSALDSINRRLFIADYSNNRILIFNLDANDRPQDYMADYVLGQTDFISNISGVTQNKFSGPVRLHYDSDHNRLFVLDRNNSRILIFDLSSGIINGMNASYVLGQTDFISNISITTQSGLSSSRGLTYDSINQKLFVADSSNSRVMIFDVASITNGEDAVNVLGQTDFISNGVTPTQSGLNYPDGVAYDSTNQRLFVADKFNNRVMIFDVASITNGEDAVNVLGQTDFISNISITTQSGLSSSRDLTYDSINQKLFVADSSNSRVMIFDVASITNGEDAVNVLGQTDFISNGVTPTQSGLNYPDGVAYDSTNQRLFVADKFNNRVMIFQLLKITTASLSLATVGQSYSAAISASGGEPPYTCSLQSGSLPSGLTVNSNCTINGTPSSGSEYNFTVRVYDSAITSPETTGFWYDKSLTLTVNPAPVASVTTPLGGGAPGAFSGGGVSGISLPTPVFQTILPDGTIVINPPVVTPPVSITEIIQTITEPITEMFTPSTPSTSSGQVPPTPPAPSAVEGFPSNSSGQAPLSISFSPSPSSIFQNIITEAKASFNETKVILSDTYRGIKTIANTPAGKMTTKAAVIIPVAVAVAEGVAATMLPSVATTADLYSVIIRMLGLLGEALGIKKRARKWGIVYDSKTKRPIDPAYVKIISEEGKIVSERFTDMEGRFGFLVPPGRYKIEANKTHYSFPSNLNTRRDELYDNLYYGEMLNISDSSIVNVNIPMDPVDIDWNEEIKKKIMSFNPNKEILKKSISRFFFLAGFILSPLIYWITPSPFNLAVIFFYFFILTIQQFGFKPKTFGRIYDKETGKPLSFAKIKVFFADNPDQAILTSVSDITGRYYILVVAKGSYLLDINGKRLTVEAQEKVINFDLWV